VWNLVLHCWQVVSGSYFDLPNKASLAHTLIHLSL
jgi:hypothetical protein